jgi:FkbM family methyltransferase
MRGVLEPGDVVIDAGAYKGGYTYTMRREIGSSGIVYAFEPQPELAAFLRRAVEAFGWQNVHVEETGLSDASGEATLYASPDGPSQLATLVQANAGTDSRTYPVRLETLDSFVTRNDVRRPVALIKCDVEGHELDVFRGAERILREDRPRLLFECEARHEPSRSVSRVFDFITGLGYSGFFFQDGRQVDATEFDPEEHQVLGRDPYVNLFAFEPS